MLLSKIILNYLYLCQCQGERMLNLRYFVMWSVCIHWNYMLPSSQIAIWFQNRYSHRLSIITPSLWNCSFPSRLYIHSVLILSNITGNYVISNQPPPPNATYIIYTYYDRLLVRCLQYWWTSWWNCSFSAIQCFNFQWYYREILLLVISPHHPMAHTRTAC